VNPTAIAVRAVEKRFGGAAALAGIDLELDAGASLAVLGPNGAGKSTLIRLMAGLGRPTAGNLEIEGAPASGRDARARVGLLADATFLYPQLSARENLIFAGRLYSLADPSARADALLADEGMGEVANRPVGEFSRGMAQRLAIARSLVHDPRILLLDEPFTGLDRRGAERLSQRLRRLHQEGRTLVLVTHDFSRAAEVADRAIVLSRGRIVGRLAAGDVDADSLERAYLEVADTAA
jgi:heme exporter protein A